MESKAMKILIIEDDIDDCNRFVNCIKERKDIELVKFNSFASFYLF